MTKYFNSFRQTAPVKPDEYTLSILAVMPEAVPVSDIIGYLKKILVMIFVVMSLISLTT